MALTPGWMETLRAVPARIRHLAARVLLATYRRLAITSRWVQRRLTGAGQMVVAGAVATAVLGVDTEQTTAYQAFTFLGALLVVSSLSLLPGSLWRRTRLRIERELPRYATAGEPFEYGLLIHNDSPRAQKGLSIQEDFAADYPTLEQFRLAPEPDPTRNRVDRWLGYYRFAWLTERLRNGRAEITALPLLAAHGDTRTSAVLTPLARGVVRLSGAGIARPAPLNLVRAWQWLDAPASVTVLPRRYPLPPLALPGARRYQQGGVSLASSVGDSEEFMGLRAYRPGDPMSRVHWKSFARVGHPVVREFHDEFFERHALVLDCAALDAPAAVFEEAVSVAASFVWTLDTRDCLLDLLFVGERAHRYTAGRGRMQSEHLLEVLAGVQAQAPRSLDELRRTVLGHESTLTSAIVVLAGWNDAKQSLVDEMRRRGITVLALAVTADGTGDVLPPGTQRLRVGQIATDLVAAFSAPFPEAPET